MSVNLNELLTIAQAAKRLPYSEPTLRNMIAGGRVQAVRIGGHVFVAESELQAKLGDRYQPVASAVASSHK